VPPSLDGLETRRWNGTKSAFADCASDLGAPAQPLSPLMSAKADRVPL